MPCLLFFDNVCAGHHAPDKSWTFTFRFENDLFADTDRYYTNGIKLSWSSPDLARFIENDKMPVWGKQIVNWLPYRKMEGLQRNIVFSIGQNIFTPEDSEARILIKNDRPYAGWLYGSAAFHYKNYRHLDTFEIQAGVVGPLSMARETQNLVHDLRSVGQANGWNHQIENEPGLILIHEHKDRIITPISLAGIGFDAITHYGGALGNVYTYVNAGVEMRLGLNLPTDFGTSLLRPGGETNAPADTGDPRYQQVGHGFSLHLFAAVSGRMVFRNIFLDGNTFRDSHRVDKEFLVGDLVFGISLIMDSVKLSYAQALRTREFKDQDHEQNFGSISISYTY